MQSLQFDPVLLTGTLLLFAVVAIGMLLAPLVLGFFLRPRQPNVEKDAIYECGEPTIGTSNVQFDLRFYVVALLFIVFDVEVAFFFPWAVVFGKANTLAKSDYRLSDEQRQEVSNALLSQVDAPVVETDAARKFLRIALIDLLAFFGIVLVGFAYVWRRGDLDWVRSVARQRAMEMNQAPQPPPA
ncbi:MAG: NADH-quinone oxidoreductase subunit A [Planctomycetota bacterium]